MPVPIAAIRPKNSHPVLANFVYDSASTAYFARMSSAPYDGRKYGINRLVQRLKSAGIYTLIDEAWLLRSANEQSSLLGLKGVCDITKASTPTFAANDGWTTDANTKYLDTGWNPVTRSVDITDFHVAAYSETALIHANSDLGLFDGGGNGITLNCGSTSLGGEIGFRANGPAVITATGVTPTDGKGFILVSVKSGVYTAYRNGKLVETGAYTPVAPVNMSLHLLVANGSSAFPARKLGYVSVGKSLTATQVKNYFAIVQTYNDACYGGWPDLHDAGYQPQNVTAEYVVYGANMQGCLAAYEAMRQGRTAVIVGGWRERALGGMTTGGIGVLDIDTLNSIGGLPRLMVSRINTVAGTADTNTTFEPRVAQIALRGFLDSAHADGIDIPIYWSNGVQVVSKSGTRLLSFTTADGRTFSGSQFCDCSYEGDLLALAGCSNIVGREAAGTGNEAYSGERGIVATQGGNTNQYYLGGTTGPYYNIDPYITPGNPASGRIAGVNAPSGVADGTADSKVQAYNFRLTVLNDAREIADVDNTPPPGFSLATYEAFFRFLKALTDDGKVYGVDYDINEIMYFVSINSGAFWDVNQYMGFGPNYHGQNWTYPTATYAARETIWKAHENYIRGLWYVMRYGRTNEGETRVPAAMETEARTYGWDRKHYVDPHPNDSIWWPTQLYVREARRLIGDYIHNANDITAADGTAPRSVKTIGCASYKIDSHHVEAIADPNGGTPRIWNTGMVVIASGGVDQIAPLPFEIILPKVAECTNLTAPFCVSATHLAFGSIRMEAATMTLAQAAGLAAAVALENSNQNIQVVDYPTLRTRLLASNTLVGEVAPVLPQVN